MTQITDKQVTGIQVSADQNSVIITFVNNITSENESIDEDLDTETKIQNEYRIKCAHRPSKDFLDCLKSMRKYGLEVCEMEVTSKELPKWTVSGIKIAGDMDLRQSRVVLTMAKMVERTGKTIQFKTPQVTMYPGTEEAGSYHNAEKLSLQIEKMVDEVWQYLNGKYDDEISNQLPLFSTEPKLQTNFTR